MFRWDFKAVCRIWLICCRDAILRKSGAFLILLMRNPEVDLPTLTTQVSK
jgi:hypothetical protein